MGETQKHAYGNVVTKGRNWTIYSKVNESGLYDYALEYRHDYGLVTVNTYNTFNDAYDVLLLFDPSQNATKEQASPVDMVNSPPHYNQGKVECIEAIRAALTADEFRGFCKGNAMKYVFRERLKGGMEDIKKAEWYLAKMQEKTE